MLNFDIARPYIGYILLKDMAYICYYPIYTMSERLNLVDRYDLTVMENTIDLKINNSCMNLQNATNACFDKFDIHLNAVENKVNLVILGLTVVSAVVMFMLCKQ